MAFLIRTKKTKLDPINLQNIRFVEIPPPTYKNDNLDFSYFFWLFIVPFSVIFLSIFSVAEISDEKKNRIHTYMIVTGMNRHLYYLSYFICCTLKMWIFLILPGLITTILIPVS